MTGRPGGRVIRALAPVTLSAVLVAAPAWCLSGAAGAQPLTPQVAAETEVVPNPDPAFARITIDEVSPRVLDGDSSAGGRAVGTVSGVPLVTVTGTLTNVGSTPLESVDVRLQRGPRAPDSSSVRDPLVWSEPSFGVRGEFERVAEVLAPGESITYRVSMPARETPGGTAPDLQLTEPGVYPLLVNVNGTPEGGVPARLDDARTLLPVLRAPSPVGTTGVDDDEVGTAEPADEPGPLPVTVPLTMLWPLASAPTRVAAVPGAEGPDPVVMLTDGSLLDEFSEAGRLTGLVRAAHQAFTGPGGPELRRATCVAVDPELLATVSEIADGRTVLIDDGAGPSPVADGDRGLGSRDRDRDDHPSTPADPGVVSADADRWLGELRELVDDSCVVALPAAQADLGSVAAVGSDRLTRAALDRRETVERVLGVAPVPDVLVPASGTLDPGAASVLMGEGTTAVVAAPSTRTDTGLVPPPGTVGLAGTPGNRALTYSATVGSALAATGYAPENPRYSDPATRYPLTADSDQARLQDARATLLAPLIDALDSPADPGPVPGSPAALAVQQGVLAVPPQVWTVDGASALSLAESLRTQLSAGRLRAVPLVERLGWPLTEPDGSLYPDPTGVFDPGAVDPYAEDPSGPTVSRLAADLEGISTLYSMVDTTEPSSASAGAHLAPFTGDALRAISETGRRAEGDGLTLESGTGTAARVRTVARLDRLRNTVDATLARVDLLPPGSVFTMASPNSPLLLVIRNGLPYPVLVDVQVSAPGDLRVDPVGSVQLPASGSWTLQAPTQSDAGGGARRTVAFSLTSPDGRPIAEPVELSVQTGGYPLAQAFAIGAAALALVLVGRRYLRYRRGISDPADEGHRP